MQAVRVVLLANLIFSCCAFAADETATLAENPSAAPLAAATATATTTATAVTDAASTSLAASTNVIVTAIMSNTPPSLTNDATLSIEVKVKVESGPGQIPASRAYVTVGTNRFAFLVPGGFKIDSSDAQRVTMVRTDSGCVLSIRVLEALPQPGLTPADCREKIAQEHPSCVIEEEFSLAAGNSSGPAFEIRWKGDGGVRRAARIAYVPMRAGVVEFSIDSNPDKFGAMLTHLNYVMLTFRASDLSGKIEPTPLSDKI